MLWFNLYRRNIMNAAIQDSIIFTKARERAPRKKAAWYAPILENVKALKGFLAVLTTLLTIAIAGYFVSEKLNTFVTKDEMEDVVKKSDLAPIVDSILLLKTSQADTTANVNKMYNLLLDLHYKTAPKKK